MFKSPPTSLSSTAEPLTPSRRGVTHASRRGVTHAALFAALFALSVSSLACDGGTIPDNPKPKPNDKCEKDTSRCQGSVVEVCALDDATGALDWKESQTCSFGRQTCEVSGNQASCVDLPSCSDGKKNQDETDVDCGGTICAPCALGKACTTDGDCAGGVCASGVCVVCKTGSASCYGNQVRSCKSDQSGWDPLATCKPLAGEVCNIDSKQCVPSTPIGSPKATGTYYLFSMFKTDTSEFKGGYDVDSYVEKVGDKKINYIYVNNKQGHLDVYTVVLEDTDGDKKMEPNQHPENPDAKGPIEHRKLTFLKTYTNVTLGPRSASELYAARDRIYFLKNESKTNPKGYKTTNLYEFIFASGKTNLVVKGLPGLPLSSIGYDPIDKRWIGAFNSKTRRVYGYYPDAGGWAIEFDYPDLAGSHLDGLEVVSGPKGKNSYVYVSDMTSDFLAQYTRDATTGKWVQKNVFEYQENDNQLVEGMGFGAFQHFWITGGKSLYEVGGGDLQKYVGPQID